MARGDTRGRDRVPGHHQGVAPHAFASDDALDAAALARAPVRYPRPSRLDEPLVVKPARAAEAAEALGLGTVGDLLEHLPRDTGEARTVATLRTSPISRPASITRAPECSAPAVRIST